jgi:hypothetical protein
MYTNSSRQQQQDRQQEAAQHQQKWQLRQLRLLRATALQPMAAAAAHWMRNSKDTKQQLHSRKPLQQCTALHLSRRTAWAASRARMLRSSLVLSCRWWSA